MIWWVLPDLSYEMKTSRDSIGLLRLTFSLEKIQRRLQPKCQIHTSEYK